MGLLSRVGRAASREYWKRPGLRAAAGIGAIGGLGGAVGAGMNGAVMSMSGASPEETGGAMLRGGVAGAAGAMTGPFAPFAVPAGAAMAGGGPYNQKLNEAVKRGEQEVRMGRLQLNELPQFFVSLGLQPEDALSAAQQVKTYSWHDDLDASRAYGDTAMQKRQYSE